MVQINLEMRIKLSPELRKVYAEKILDVTNIGVGALLFGQFLSEKGFSLPIALLGLWLLVVGYIFVYYFYEGGV